MNQPTNLEAEDAGRVASNAGLGFDEWFKKNHWYAEGMQAHRIAREAWEAALKTAFKPENSQNEA